MNKRQRKKYIGKSNVGGIKGKRNSSHVKCKTHRGKSPKSWRPPTPNPDDPQDADFRIKNKSNINSHRKDDTIY